MNLNRKMHSINYKTLGYLIVFSVTILLLLWIFQILFLNIFYSRYQASSIEALAKKVQKFEGDLPIQLEEAAYVNNVCMEYVHDSGISIPFNMRMSGCLLGTGNVQITDYKNQLAAENKSLNALKLVNPDNNTKSLLYAVRVTDGFVFINSPLEDLNSTTKILRGQLIYITLIGIVLACLIAYFLSKRITKPITSITNQARRIATGKDIRYYKTGVSEIDDLVDTLNIAQDEIEKTDQLRRDLMANVGHDLKTPLTMIKAYAEMVKDISYKDNKKREEHLDIIVAETDRLNILVNDIVDLSKLQADAEELCLTTFDLSEEINEIVKRYSIIKETEDYNFKIKIPKKMIVCADRNKLNQVIYNLINNAINYTGKDKLVTIKATLENNKYLIGIVDTGKGIKEEEINLIWNKYYKNEKNHQRNVVGTGIGLSIVKEILVRHGFEYGVRSKKNKGTTFYFLVDKK